MRSTVAMEVPPNFITRRGMGLGRMARGPGGGEAAPRGGGGGRRTSPGGGGGARGGLPGGGGAGGPLRPGAIARIAKDGQAAGFVRSGTADPSSAAMVRLETLPEHRGHA